MENRVLVTGATGFLGSRVIQRLLKNNSINTIIAAGRTPRKEVEVDHSKVKYLMGDLTDYQYVEKIVAPCNLIVNCASLSSPWGKYQDFYTANIVTQKNLIKVAEEKEIERFVYISTPSLYFNNSKALNINESEIYPDSFVNAYAKTKFEAEQFLIKSNLDFISIRPRALVGRGDTVIMPRLIRAQKEGRLRQIGDGKNIVDLTGVENVAYAIELALFTAIENCNTAYNITNDEPMNLWENINYVIEQLDLGINAKPISKKTGLMVASIMEFAAKITGKEPTLTKYSIGTLANSLTLDITKAKEKLGYTPVISVRDSIDEFVDWYKKTRLPVHSWTVHSP